MYLPKLVFFPKPVGKLHNALFWSEPTVRCIYCGIGIKQYKNNFACPKFPYLHLSNFLQNCTTQIGMKKVYEIVKNYCDKNLNTSSPGTPGCFSSKCSVFN